MVKAAGLVLPVSAYQSSGTRPATRKEASKGGVFVAAIVDEIDVALGELAVQERDRLIVAGVRVVEVRARCW